MYRIALLGEKMKNALEQRLVTYDGKAVSILSEAQAASRNTPNYLYDLVRLCFDPRTTMSDGATWILKAELEAGMDLPSDRVAQIVQSLDHIQSWQAALHIFQSIEYIDVTHEQAVRILDWAKQYAPHARPFLRAWSLHARAVLGQAFPDLKHEVGIALEAAGDDPAASVRARARQLRKGLGLNDI